jgi:HEAT repeat protein
MLKEEFSGEKPEFLVVRHLLDHFIRALKNVMIYPKDNPVPQELKKNLSKRFTDFFENCDELNLKVTSSQLRYGEEVVYEDQTREEGLAFALYRDGIREIGFKKKVSLEELSEFLEILKLGIKRVTPEDDLVTLLWGKDFGGISYLVVDEFLTEELSLSPTFIPPPDFEKIYYSRIDLPESPEAEKIIDEKIKIVLNNIKTFAHQEIENLNLLLKKDEEYRSLDTTLNILEEILSQPGELSDFNETVSLMEKSLDFLIEQANFSSAYKILEKLKEWEKTQRELSPPRGKRIKEAVDRAGDGRRIKNIGEVLNFGIGEPASGGKQEKIDLYSVQDYLTSLNWNAVSNLVDLLGDLKTFPLRRMLCHVLEKMGQEYIEIVGKGIYDPRWYVVRNVVNILGGIGKEKGLDFLKPALKHNELVVRKEALRSLEKIGGAKAGQLSVSLLDDPSPKIRLNALSLLTKWKVKEAIEPLLQIVEDKEFIFMEEEEKKIILFALAKIGEDRVIDHFKRWIRKPAFFNRKEKVDTKILAIKALGQINTPKGVAFLKEVSKKNNKALRDASRQALSRVESEVDSQVS